MNAWLSTWTPFKLAVVISVPLFAAAFVLAGSGHWRQLPLDLLFPFGPGVAMAASYSHMGGVISIVTGVAQFPVYALILRIGARARRLRTAAIVVCVTHAIAAVLVMQQM
jgi:hypothetical protein